ncbi:MAG TPA: hypothetical protein VGW57_06200 [Chthoniobacterales bacterium]|nr:hypothetical protein [Chthoniobacterales bacterium]
MAKIFPSRFFLVASTGGDPHLGGEVYSKFGLEKVHPTAVSTAGGFASVTAAVVRSAGGSERKYLWIERIDRDMPAFRYIELKKPGEHSLSDSELARLFAGRTADRVAELDIPQLQMNISRVSATSC